MERLEDRKVAYIEREVDLEISAQAFISDDEYILREKEMMARELGQFCADNYAGLIKQTKRGFMLHLGLKCVVITAEEFYEYLCLKRGVVPCRCKGEGCRNEAQAIR